MSLLQAIQDDILARLRAAYPALEVEPFPDRPENRKVFHPVATLLVGYSGSRDGAPLDLVAMAQARTCRFDINILARELGGDRGAVALVDGVRAALTGQRAAGGEIRIAGDRFHARNQAVWEYSVSLEIIVPMVPQLADVSYPTLSQIDLVRDGTRQGGVPLPPL